MVDNRQTYVKFGIDTEANLEFLTYRRVVVHFRTSDDFSLHFFSKPSEPTELQKQKVIENSQPL